MEVQDQLVAIERRLWTNDAAFYEAHLTDDALLIFAETGAITRDVAVSAIRKAYRDETLADLSTEIVRFHEMLSDLVHHLETGTELRGTTEERLLQERTDRHARR
jgi:hypothetical protein